MTDLRNLPEQVIARLAAVGTDLAAAHLQATQRGKAVEARAFARPEIRLDENGNPSFEGYATVYDYPYDVAGGIARGGWVETIVAGACDKSVRERDDVRLLVNHDGIPLARTKSKTLTLESDKVGLRSSAPSLDASSPLVATVVSAMNRGDLDEMSFAFQVLRQEWNGDYTERLITEVKLFDVSVVTYPANPAAIAQLRADDPVLTPAPAGMTLAAMRMLADQSRLAALA